MQRIDKTEPLPTHPAQRYGTRIPESTYRVQFHAGFTFADAAGIVPYLARLGVTHLYASPYLKAAPGSTHGYDVVDHNQLNPELGGEEAYLRLCEVLHAHGISQILDTVPNHVGTNENQWWNDVLEHGRDSRHAAAFDIDWDAGPHCRSSGKLLLPVLGKPYGQALEDGDLTLVHEQGKWQVKYFQRLFPIDPRTLKGLTPEQLNGTSAGRASYDALDRLLQRQHYRLAHWRTAADEINYRRFFDINDLAALAMERQDVFDIAHQLTCRLILEGHVTGLRIDHPDGLYDPKQYFQRLQTAEISLPVWVEKILAPEEELPVDWPVRGTSGYDFLNRVSQLFVDGSNEASFTRHYSEFSGLKTTFAELAYEKKKLILERSFAGELNVLGHGLHELAWRSRHSRDFTFNALRGGLREMIACFPVYRSYIDDAGHRPDDEAWINHAVEQAAARNPSMQTVFDFIRQTLLRRFDDRLEESDRQLQRHFAGKFQQLTAPVTAKGVEDTAFYIYNRLLSLNEVGGDPGIFGSGPAKLHDYFRARQARWPDALSTLSTHDTKRSEDVRARLNVLSEADTLWFYKVRAWHTMNEPHRAQVHGQPVPAPNEEYHLFQCMLGAWPIDAARLSAYMRKATREAKVHTSWTEPDADYESAMDRYIQRILDPKTSAGFLADVQAFVERISPAATINTWAQTLLKLTAPGIPDIYQGCELMNFSLVDPDNRRAVDYPRREALLKAGDADRSADAMKLRLHTRMLHERRMRPGLFREGDYLPLRVEGALANHVFAFARQLKNQSAIVVAPRLVFHLLDASTGLPPWGDTALHLPGELRATRFRNLLTGTTFRGEPSRLSGLLEHLPLGVFIST